MKHHEAAELFGNSKDRQLSTDEAERVREHVRGCEECASVLETYKWFSQALANDPDQEHPTSDQLARYSVQRELVTQPERQTIEEHTAQCPQCMEEVRLTQTAAFGEPSRSLIPRIGRRLHKLRRPEWQDLLAASLIFAVLLGFMVSKANQPVEAVLFDQVLSGDRLAGTQIVEARGSIRASATTIQSGGDVIFRAGDSVALGDGFSTATNASFTIEIAQAHKGNPLAEPDQSQPQT